MHNASGGSHDFRVAGTSEPYALYVSGFSDRVGMGTSRPSVALDVWSSAEIRLGGTDSLRIRSVSSDDMLHVSGNGVGVGTASPLVGADVRGGLSVSGGSHFDGAGDDVFEINSLGGVRVFNLGRGRDSVSVGSSSPRAVLDVSVSSEFDVSGTRFRVHGSGLGDLIDVSDDGVSVGGSVGKAFFESHRESRFRLRSSSERFLVGDVFTVNSSGVFVGDTTASSRGYFHLRIPSDRAEGIRLSQTTSGMGNGIWLSRAMLGGSPYIITSPSLVGRSGVDVWTGGRGRGNGYGYGYGYGPGYGVLLAHFGTTSGVGTSSPEARFGVVGGGVFNQSGGAEYFQVRGVSNSDSLFVVRGDAEEVWLSGTSFGRRAASVQLYSSGSAVFNTKQSSGGDFAVNGKGFAGLLTVDASANGVGIGTTSPRAPLDVSLPTDKNENVIVSLSGHTKSALWFHNGGGTPMMLGAYRKNRTDYGFVIAASDTDRDTLNISLHLTEGIGFGGVKPDKDQFNVRGGAIFNIPDGKAFQVESKYKNITGGRYPTIYVPGGNTTRVGIGGILDPDLPLTVHDAHYWYGIPSLYTSPSRWNTIPVGSGTGSYRCRNMTGSWLPLTFEKETLHPWSSIRLSNPRWNTHSGYMGIYMDQIGLYKKYPPRRITSTQFATLRPGWLRFSHRSACNQFSRHQLVARFTGSVEISGGSLIAYNYPNQLVYSDARIKKEARSLDSSRAWSVLEGVRPVSYQMRDHLRLGTARTVGVLAQEAELVDSSPVQYASKYLPNIYRSVRFVSEDEGLIGVDIPELSSEMLAKGDRLRLFVSDERGTEHRVEVRVFSVERTAQTARVYFREDSEGRTQNLSWSEAIHLFAYGKKVSDYRSVAYDKLYMANLKVTQDLLKEQARLRAADRASRAELAKVEALYARFLEAKSHKK